jgi:spermidine synthase
MTFALCLIFFLSGSSALIFETLWFHQASLTFGNSVWASSLVLTAFMAGLALGNAAAARYGQRLANSLRTYALLEVVIAVTGLGLVLTLPRLAPTLAPLLRPFLEQPWLVNPARLLAAFALLLLPSTAMGATLPLVVRALSAADPHFARVLGRLYGWNTLGAVLGALASEVVLIDWLGVRGSGVVASLLNGSAAALAALLAARIASSPGSSGPKLSWDGRESTPVRRLLLAAFLSGFALLALEVVWFRFLLLFLGATSLAFAVMLAVVLAGIALGGLFGGWWLRRGPGRTHHLASLAWASGILCVLTYLTFQLVLREAGPQHVKDWHEVALLGAWLMFPVSFLSGTFFTVAGTALQRELAAEALATGLLTLANTTGAALGSLIAGFVLLPTLGMERSIFSLALLYGLVGLAVPRSTVPAGSSRFTARTIGAILVAALLLFPFGLMEKLYLKRSTRFFTRAGAQIVAVREGLTETIQYARTDFIGEPYYYRLITNGFSMSASTFRAQRYMKLYVYWPVAVRPNPKRALLISYGVGTTAKALTDTKSLETIDVVDISREILEMNEIVYPDPAEQPLRDPRVRVHVEDGRYFLQTTDRRFDLITGEPPPPKMAGIVNLYTREYFQLIYDRLAPRGIATYWLPVRGLNDDDTRAIVAAFCDSFADCSLWLGTNLDWMLIGTREMSGPSSESGFAQQWQDPEVGKDLRELGLETPAQLGPLFVADAPQLRKLTQGAQPLVDNWPKRLTPARAAPRGSKLTPMHRAWMDPDETRERFRESEFVRRLWPPRLREESLRYFDYQRIINDLALASRPTEEPVLPALHRVLTETSLTTLPLWLMGSNADQQRIVERVAARGTRGPLVHYLRGVAAIARRDFEQAERFFGLALALKSDIEQAARLRVFALLMAERRQEAAAALNALPKPADPSPRDLAERLWLEEKCGSIPDS